MTKRIALILITLLVPLVLPAATSAHARAHLSIARGEHMIRDRAALDRPTSVALSGCYKPSTRSVACWVTEFGAHTLIYDNGEPIVGDLSYEGVARSS